MTHYHAGRDGEELVSGTDREYALRRLQHERDRLLRIKCDNHGSIHQRGHEHGAYVVSLTPRHTVTYDLKPRTCHSASAPIALWFRGPCNRDDITL